MNRRDFLKGIAGAIIEFKPYDKKEIYGINLTRRLCNEKIANQEMIEILDKMHINDVALHLLWFQDGVGGCEFKDNIDNKLATPNDSNVKELINILKSRNKYIIIKPTVYVLQDVQWYNNQFNLCFHNKEDNINSLFLRDSKWRGKIKPSDINLWFENYEELIKHYVKLTKNLGIDAVCIGTELSSMQVYTENWQHLIKNIRKEFNGRITYCANWDAYNDIEFFSDLDYISISAYFPLVKKDEDPSLEKLINSWMIIGEDLKKLSKRFNKEVVFGEIGYRSASGSATQHNANLTIVDYEEQRLCFEALDYVLRNRIIPVSKAYLWVGDTHGLGYNNKVGRVGFEIFGKPAEKEILSKS